MRGGVRVSSNVLFPSTSSPTPTQPIYNHRNRSITTCMSRTNTHTISNTNTNRSRKNTNPNPNPSPSTHYHQRQHYWGRGTKADGFKEPFYPIPGKYPRICRTPLEAMSGLRSNQRVFIHGAAATPTCLVFAMCEYAEQHSLRNLETIHIHLHGETPFVHEQYKHRFRDNSLFIGGNVRKAVNRGEADFTPIFLSEIPKLFEDPEFELDWSLIQVSPPDKHGYCSLGTSVDCARSAVLSSSNVVGLINKCVPRTHGDGHIHISHFDAVYYEDKPLPEMGGGGAVGDALDEATVNIGKLIAENLIPDRACLQLGIGGIPDAVLTGLTQHKDLGIHTEMFADGVLDLLEVGAISNHFKYHHRGKLCTSFLMGTQRLYSFVDDNPLVVLCDCSYVNDTNVIRANDRVHAINSCIEIDITGQVCADSIGTRMFSGIGGQMDFMRGAALSKHGKAIMAMQSTIAKTGASKILPTLKSGAGVVTTRAHVQHIVTEYGLAKLHGKSLRERAKLVIDLAHPDHREDLERAAFARFGKLTLNGSDGELKPET